MINRSNNQLTRFFFLPVLLFPASHPLAAIEDFSPYAYVSAVHDTNTFRSKDNEEDDTVGHVGVGLKSDLKLSRQHLLFNGLVDRAEYSDEDQLSHTKVDGTATWVWQVGNLWSGDLGYRYNREMSSFNQQLVRERDMRKRKTAFFEGGYQLHPDWRLTAGVDYSDVTYQDRDRLDRDTTAGQFEVRYRNTLNTKVGASVRYQKTDLKNDTDLGGGVLLDNDYDVLTVSGLFSWEASGKSTLDARLGYTDLSYDELDDRDFQGTSGRLTWKWLLTGKTKMDIDIWRETSSLNDEIASYVLTKGVSVKPIWSATPKITIRGEISYEDDDFKGNNDIRRQLGLGKRSDETWRIRISANWAPRRILRFSLGYVREERDSSDDIREFTNNQVFARAQYSY